MCERGSRGSRGLRVRGKVCAGVIFGLAALLDGELVLLERMAYVDEVGFKC